MLDIRRKRAKNVFFFLIREEEFDLKKWGNAMGKMNF